MKYIYPIILTFLLIASCKNDDYFYKDTPETVNSSIWDYLQNESRFDYYTDLIKQYELDSLFNNNNSYTLFIPAEESLKALDTTLFEVNNVLLYQIFKTQVNLQSINAPTLVKTMLEKFAVLEYNQTDREYNIDGVSILGASSQFNNGFYYELEGCAVPPPNIYEYFELNSAALKDYVDYTDSSYFDIEASTPIGITEEGSIYDSVFYTVNGFSEEIFPVKQESRDKFATFTIFSDAQYLNAIEIMKEDLDVDEIPEAWLNDLFMPRFLVNSVFDKRLEYDDFTPAMKNVSGELVEVDVSNIDQNSRSYCSNGVVYFLNDFIIDESFYRSFDPIFAYDMVDVVVEGSKWVWSEIASEEGLDGTGVVPKLQQSNYAEGGNLLVLDFGANFDTSRHPRITFTKKGVFGAKELRLVWGGTSAYCGLWDIFINGELLQARTVDGKDAEHFDSYMFTNTSIRSVTGLPTFRRKGNNYNTADFKIETLTEYSDVKITFEYVGPSVDFNGDVRGIPGIVFDYVLLELI